MALKFQGLHPKVIDAVQATLAEAQARGLNVDLFCGYRSGEEQDGLYAQGRTKPGSIITNAKAYESWHNFGLAVDLVFKTDKGWTWEPGEDKWASLGEIGKGFGFEWGGDWEKFPDRPHFQMRGQIPNVKYAKKLMDDIGIVRLWDMI